MSDPESRYEKVVQRAIQRGSFCTLATSSPAHRPHVVGVLYVVWDDLFYVSTLGSSVKADAGRLKAITSHGELDDPDSSFLRITPGARVATYGLGVSIRQLIRDPIHASRSLVRSR